MTTPCPHETIIYSPVLDSEGEWRQRWICTSCVTEFLPRAWMDVALAVARGEAVIEGEEDAA